MEKQEPYRATKLWNEVINDFRNGMPLKKHRHRIQFHNDCFTATECIGWLHFYLKNSSNFGPNITRQQTVQLLQKFLKCHVIESVTLKSKSGEFSDSSNLYRFTQVSPICEKHLPLQQIQSPACLYNSREKLPKERKDEVPNAKHALKNTKENIPECHFIKKKLSITEINNAWKEVVSQKLKGLLSSADDILDFKVFSGSHVRHNMCWLSKTGVVTLIDKTDDIPYWVVSAMKCLVNWPNASGSGSCLPNYPGFENDVFKVVRDFFINPEVPLLPEYISTPLLEIFSTYLLNSPSYKKYNKHMKLSESAINASEFIARPNTKEAKTSTPIIHNDLSICPSLEGKILLDDPDVMWDYPSDVCFETEFTTNKPVTRVVAEKNIMPTLYKANAPSLLSIDSVSTISVCSQYPQDPETEKCKQTSLTMHERLWNSTSDLNKKNSVQQSQVVRLSTSTSYPQKVRKSQSFDDDVMHGEEFSKFYCGETGPNAGLTLDFYQDEKYDLNDSCLSTKTIIESDNVDYCEAKIWERDRGDGKYQYPSTDSEYMMESRLKTPISVKESEIDLHAEKTKKMLNICQLLLLFLPPANRRQLHLLLRVINKIVKNAKFVVDVPMSMRDYLLKTFQPAVVQSEYNKNTLFELTSFFLDNCETVFQPLPSVKEEAEQCLLRLSSGKIKYSLDDTCSLTYCELLSKQQYEEQTMSASTQALKGLLESIIRDENATEKERRKRIKKFKENHPEVYFLCFPQPEEMKTKPRKTFLNKLANLRL